MIGRYTADEAALALGVPRAAIDKWKHRRQVTPIGFIRGRGWPAPLYDIDELRPLATAYKLRLERAETRRREAHDLPLTDE